MSRPIRRKKPELVYSDGIPTAVILDIQEYREMLERMEDAADLRYLERLRKKPVKMRSFDEFLAERAEK